MANRIVLAVTGASGMPYAVRLAELLGAAPEVELHLIVSKAAWTVLDLESGKRGESGGQAGPAGLEGPMGEKFRSLAHRVYDQDDFGAPPASGSWLHAGMIVCPCSMASLAAIASGLGSNLIHRAADVTLKERRPLVLVPRETPMNRSHLRNMLLASEAGAVVMPACPGFYHQPATIADLVDHLAARILDQIGVHLPLFKRWGE
jgi:4-hydroxy-3-polyprenylbenzoate decarboxylase